MLPSAHCQRLESCRTSCYARSRCRPAARLGKQLPASRRAAAGRWCRPIAAAAASNRHTASDDACQQSSSEAQPADAPAEACSHSRSSTSDRQDSGWQPACSAFLAQQLDVSADEVAGWLDAAAHRRTLTAAKQPAAGQGQVAAAITLAEVQQLLAVLSGEGGLDAAGIRRIMRRQARPVLAEPEAYAANVRFVRQECGLSAARAAAQVPSCTAMTLPLAVLRQRRAELQRSLCLSSSDLQRMLGKSLTGLMVSTDGIEQRVATACAQIGCSRNSFGRMAAVNPRVLTQHSAGRQAVLDWCRARGWSQQELGHMLMMWPHILGGPVASLQDGFDWWITAGGLSEPEALQLLAHIPALLRKMSTPGVARKLQFFQAVIGRPLTSLVDSPSYISYSLENRTAPRTCYLSEHGIELTPSLAYLGFPDARFHRQYKLTIPAFAEWVAAWRQTPQGRLWGVKPDQSPSSK